MERGEQERVFQTFKRCRKEMEDKMKVIKRSKSCLYMPTMRCTHKECIKANGQAK